MAKGLFITFEGGEGCGKSSHIGMLADYFRTLGRECVVTREPGGTVVAERIRNLLLDSEGGAEIRPKTELLLFEAARAQHVDELIRPALEAGKVVISDRFFDSTSAYQGVARKLPAEEVAKLNAFTVGECTPDLTILLDIPVEAGLARAAKRDDKKTDRMGAQNLEFYRNVRAAFLKLARANPERFAVVDSSGDKSATFAKILSETKGRLNV